MNLQPSKLGTRGYWDQFYEREIQNFEEDSDDTGENWFDDSNAEDRVVAYIDEQLGPHDPDQTILDLGTGNGHLLFSLREADVAGRFVGIDYSPASVKFAKTVAAHEQYEDIEFRHVDFLAEPHWTSEKFDIVLDKGTLDAIALSTAEKAPERYVSSVLPLLKPGGRLIITSCNFTREELAQLVGRPYTEIKYPSFKFGGAKGSSVVTLIFR